MGLSGRIAQAFQQNPITPVISLLFVILGIIAILVTPKEEDPQIDVTMVDVFFSASSFSSKEVEQQVATKAEKLLSQIAGVEHVYSVSKAGESVVTVQFEVGVKRQEALVKVWNQVMTELHWPAHFGVTEPRVKARGINDVPILTLTFWSDDPKVGQTQIGKVASAVANIVQRVDGTRNIELSGYHPTAVNIKLNPAQASTYGVDIQSLLKAIQVASNQNPNLSIQASGREISITTSELLHHKQDIANLVIASKDLESVYLSDVAQVSVGTIKPTSHVQMGFGAAANTQGLYSAVTLAIAKKEGENAIDVSQAVLATTKALEGKVIPDNINYTVSRNSGLTAQQKARTLINKLFFATLAVVVLVWFALGRRAAVIVGLAVGITLLITLFSSWAWGFTLNRISLFALIFSIGILVDDAIVVVENIHRCQHKEPNLPLSQIIPKAVDEVGSSTILATFTVIVALLPMAFVSGLMGPYMSPIPINASTGMLLSLIIAFTITPWLAVRLLKTEKNSVDESSDVIGRVAANVLSKFISAKASVANQWRLFIAIWVLILAVLFLPMTGAVLLKMLPFDNKPTIAVTVDMPEGTTSHNTLAVLQQMSAELSQVEEVVHFQLYAGVNSPITFNGLVRQYYLRQEAHLGEITISLQPNGLRQRGSHETAKLIRALLTPIAQRHQAKIKMVEEPSGPPTLAPIVAEVYGPDEASRHKLAEQLEQSLEAIPEVVDVDTSMAVPKLKWQVRIDRPKAKKLGFDSAELEFMVHQLLSSHAVGYMHQDQGHTPLPITLSLPDSDKGQIDVWLNNQAVNRHGEKVALSEFVTVEQTHQSRPIYHKNLRPVTYVVADMAGHTDSPLYGMFQANEILTEHQSDIQVFYTKAPKSPYTKAIKWDGEWQITYETFRDMGIAYAAGLLLIYLLIVGKFKSYRLPLLIMAPIPLTIIGIFPDHWLLDAKFTAPSMIGMIALAGIIVRNSILLVDFIEQRLAEGGELKQAVIASVQMRARPIVLTALAAMVGALFILSDPIFKGLAISLIFGMSVSSVLTLLVIPIAYYRSKTLS